MDKRNNIELIKQFISDNIGDLKGEGRYNNGIIFSQGKYRLI
jgi:hypothetical protein